MFFAKNILDSFYDIYFSEDEELKKRLLNDSMENLTDEAKSEIKKFIKSDRHELLKNEILLTFNIDELKETKLQGYFYDEEKKKFDIKSPGFTPQNLLKPGLLKDGIASYALNLFKENILEIDLGTSLGKDYKIGNMFNIGLENNDKTAKELSFLFTELGDYFNKETRKLFEDYFWNAIKETKAEASDFISISKGNTDASAGVTISAEGVKETVGIKNVLYKAENKKITMTNTGTIKQNLNGKYEEMNIQSEVRKKEEDSIFSSKFQFISDNEKKSFITSLGISLCTSELQRKNNISFRDDFLKFGITYSRPDITKSDNTLNIKTTFNVCDTNTEFNLGFKIDTSSFSNSKMILTYSLKGL